MADLDQIDLIDVAFLALSNPGTRPNDYEESPVIITSKEVYGWALPIWILAEFDLARDRNNQLSDELRDLAWHQNRDWLGNLTIELAARPYPPTNVFEVIDLILDEADKNISVHNINLLERKMLRSRDYCNLVADCG